MSATGRSDVRRTNDVYITPSWCIRRLLEAYPLPAGVVMDPCAAGGELLTVVKALHPRNELFGVELRPECLADLIEVTDGNAAIGNFLELAREAPDQSVDVVITNPPFSLAEEFIRTCLRISKVTIMLLRINALRGDGRQVLMAQTKPGLLVLPDRPSFTGRGTDATEYAWFVWGDPAFTGRWQMLRETPEAEIKAWNRIARELHPIEPEPVASAA